MKHTTAILLGVFALALVVSSELFKSNQQRLIECVQGTEGTDADCEQCYFEVYGEYPN
jgi:hypothetical protein